MKALVLAAGLGTRLRPFSEILPKPAMPFLNIPLIYYPLHLLQRWPLTDVVVNTHHLAERMAAVARSYPDTNVRLHISYEPEKPLGTGGAIGWAHAHLQDASEFALINGDELIFPSRPRVLDELLSRHRSAGNLATLLVMKHPEVGSRFGAVWASDEGRVLGFGKARPEQVRGSARAFHFTGLQVLSQEIWPLIPEGESNIFYDVLTSAIASGAKVEAFEDDCAWLETGSLQDFLHASNICLQQMVTGRESPWLKEMLLHFWPEFAARPSLWQGRACHHHLGQLESHPVLMGDRCSVHNSVSVGGFAVLGDRVLVGANSHLENCVVASGSRVAPNTILKNTIYL